MRLDLGIRGDRSPVERPHHLPLTQGLRAKPICATPVCVMAHPKSDASYFCKILYVRGDGFGLSQAGKGWASRKGDFYQGRGERGCGLFPA